MINELFCGGVLVADRNQKSCVYGIFIDPLSSSQWAQPTLAMSQSSLQASQLEPQVEVASSFSIQAQTQQTARQAARPTSL